MEYDIESALEKRMTLLATVILLGGLTLWGLAWETRVGNPVPPLGVGVILIVIAGVLMYARSTFEDTLRVDADGLVMLRRRGEGVRELARWKQSDVCEVSMSPPRMSSSEPEKPRPTTLMVLLRDGNLLELECPERAAAEGLVSDLKQQVGALFREDLSEDVAVVRQGVKVTLRAKTGADWILPLGLGALLLGGLIFLGVKLLSLK